MFRIFNSYLNCLKLHPVKTQALTTGVLMSSGDAICQIIIEGKNDTKVYDFKRTSRFFLFGTCLMGPALRYWFVFLDKTIKRPAPVGIIQKLALDQFFMSPACLLTFLSTMTLWTTYSFEETQLKIKKDYFLILFNGYKIWPAAQLINFYLIPLQHRIMFVNTVALFWNVYLAYKSFH